MLQPEFNVLQTNELYTKCLKFPPPPAERARETLKSGKSYTHNLLIIDCNFSSASVSSIQQPFRAAEIAEEPFFNIKSLDEHTSDFAWLLPVKFAMFAKSVGRHVRRAITVSELVGADGWRRLRGVGGSSRVAHTDARAVGGGRRCADARAVG